MTPAEKAKELVDKFRKETDGIAGYNYDSVNLQCALIAVDELIKEVVDDKESEYMSLKDIYWMAVKKEIEKL